MEAYGHTKGEVRRRLSKEGCEDLIKAEGKVIEETVDWLGRKKKKIKRRIEASRA